MENKKCGYIALIGAPNIGKSTLLNNIIGEKISIVTPKAQTTRKKAKGILNINHTQAIFLDTPGIFKPKLILEKKIVSNASAGIDESDIIAVLTEAKANNFESLERNIFSKISSYNNKKKVAIINKVDLNKNKTTLLKYAEKLWKYGLFEEIFMISALKNNGIAPFLSYLEKNLPNSNWVFDKDDFTDQTEKEFAEEITREKLYMNLTEELPYSVNISTEKWEELPNGNVKIYHQIEVLRDTHKMIVIGKNGEKLKKVGIQSREELSKLFGRKVHLFLFVKVKPAWVDEFVYNR